MKAAVAGAIHMARVTCGVATRQPVYYLLLAATALAILISPKLTMFELVQEMHAVREMGLASIPLWSFLVAVFLAPMLVTRDLDGRMGLMIFPKPVSRAAYLWGKFAGLAAAITLGVVFLGLVLLLTLWLGSGLPALEGDAFRLWMEPAAAQAAPADRTVWGFVRQTFLEPTLPFVASCVALAWMESVVLAAVAVVLAAFLPPVASGSALAFAYLIGHMMDYFQGAVRAGAGRAAVEMFATLLPHMGAWSLPGRFARGAAVSGEYLCVAALYALLYCAFAVQGATVFFERREIR